MRSMLSQGIKTKRVESLKGKKDMERLKVIPRIIGMMIGGMAVAVGFVFLVAGIIEFTVNEEESEPEFLQSVPDNIEETVPFERIFACSVATHGFQTKEIGEEYFKRNRYSTWRYISQDNIGVHIFWASPCIYVPEEFQNFGGRRINET